MDVFIVLWPYLLTTKLWCWQKNTFGHTNLLLFCSPRVKSAIFIWRFALFLLLSQHLLFSQWFSFLLEITVQGNIFYKIKGTKRHLNNNDKIVTYFFLSLNFHWICNSKLVKGHLISKGLFDVIVLTKKPTKVLRISALASKRRSDQKNKCSLYH